MATLTVTLTESVTVTGEAHAPTTTQLPAMSFTGINNIYKQQVTVPNSALTQFLKFGSAEAAGTLRVADIYYIRITNHDSSNIVSVVTSDSTNNRSYAQKILPGNHIIFTSGAQNVFDANDASTTQGSYNVSVPCTADFDEIAMKAETAAVKCTIFVAYG